MSSAEEKKTDEGNEFVNEEYGVSHPMYLNLYHGMDIDPRKLEHYKEMSTNELQIYERFCQEVQKQTWEQVIPDVHTCLRFLQADKYDADKAMQRLVANQAWQQEWNLAQIMSTPPPLKLEAYRKLRARAYMGRTKDGMPIFVERLGDFMCAIPSPQGKALTPNEYVECFLYDIGLLIAKLRESYSKRENDECTWKATWIMDCKNVRLYRAMKAISTLKLLDGVTEPNFPEFAGPIYIVNVPSVVSGVWKLIRAFLDPSVVAKIQIHSSVPKEALLERMDESVLFEEFGGTNKSLYPKAEYS